MKLSDFIDKHGNTSVNEDELKELLGIKDEKYFMPEENEGYFVVGMSGTVFEELYNTRFDKEIYENTEVFRTEEEAEEHARKQRFLLQMKRDFLDNSDEIDWKDGNELKYFIEYYHHEYKLGINDSYTHQGGQLVTTNRDWLEEYISKHEEEIKKYYFEVESC